MNAKNKWNRITRRLFTIILMASLLIIQGCGNSSSNPPVVGDQDASGTYTNGSLTIDPSGTNVTHTDFKGMIYNNKFMLFSVAGHVLYDGTIDSITSKDFTATADVYKDGAIVDSGVNITGTVTTELVISGTLAGGTNTYSGGNFSLNYDAIYKRGASFARAKISGGFIGIAYASVDQNTRFDFGDNTTADKFIGLTQTLPRCDYLGAIVIPSAQVNIYQLNNISITGTSCPINNTGYAGMSTQIDGAVTDDTFYIAFTNGTNSIFSIGVNN